MIARYHHRPAAASLTTLLIACTWLTACQPNKSSVESSMPTVSKADLEALSQQRIVFAHQSVGRNILDGVRDLATSTGATVNIEESRTTTPDGRGIYHFRVGKNRDPQGKIQDFLSVWNDGAAPDADVAMLKLCYVDFNANTDAEQLANEYADAVESLSERFPSTRFIAFTSPLMTVESGIKAWISKVRGKQPDQYEENARRQVFNDILRQRFSPDRLFDIAAIEAGQGDQRRTVDVSGKAIEVLRPELTYDGGHLNEPGRQGVAAELVRLLLAQPNKRTAT